MNNKRKKKEIGLLSEGDISRSLRGPGLGLILVPHSITVFLTKK
jgi:hypothetical protein